jgi:hypothetical protein
LVSPFFFGARSIGKATPLFNTQALLSEKRTFTALLKMQRDRDVKNVALLFNRVIESLKRPRNQNSNIDGVRDVKILDIAQRLRWQFSVRDLQATIAALTTAPNFRQSRVASCIACAGYRSNVSNPLAYFLFYRG